MVTLSIPRQRNLTRKREFSQWNGVTFNGRNEHLSTSPRKVHQSAVRLARPGEKLVTMLSGHGERKLDGIASHDLGEFGKQLMGKGFKTETLNLSISPNVPANTSVLVIASPQIDLQEGEVGKLLAYIGRGGNLLWLIDEGSLHGLQPLAEKLELTLTPGVVVDPQARQLKLPITVALGASYGQHPVTHNFDYITMFPCARQIISNEMRYGIASAGETQPRMGETATGFRIVSTKCMLYRYRKHRAPCAALCQTVNRHRCNRQRNFLAIHMGNGNNLDFGINLSTGSLATKSHCSSNPSTLDATCIRNRRLSSTGVFSVLHWFSWQVESLVGARRRGTPKLYELLQFLMPKSKLSSWHCPSSGGTVCWATLRSSLRAVTSRYRTHA